MYSALLVLLAMFRLNRPCQGEVVPPTGISHPYAVGPPSIPPRHPPASDPVSYAIQNGLNLETDENGNYRVGGKTTTGYESFYIEETTSASPEHVTVSSSSEMERNSVVKHSTTEANQIKEKATQDDFDEMSENRITSRRRKNVYGRGASSLPSPNRNRISESREVELIMEKVLNDRYLERMMLKQFANCSTNYISDRNLPWGRPRAQKNIIIVHSEERKKANQKSHSEKQSTVSSTNMQARNKETHVDSVSSNQFQEKTENNRLTVSSTQLQARNNEKRVNTVSSSHFQEEKEKNSLRTDNVVYEWEPNSAPEAFSPHGRIMLKKQLRKIRKLKKSNKTVGRQYGRENQKDRTDQGTTTETTRLPVYSAEVIDNYGISSESTSSEEDTTMNTIPEGSSIVYGTVVDQPKSILIRSTPANRSNFYKTFAKKPVQTTSSRTTTTTTTTESPTTTSTLGTTHSVFSIGKSRRGLKKGQGRWSSKRKMKKSYKVANRQTRELFKKVDLDRIVTGLVRGFHLTTTTAQKNYHSHRKYQN